MTINIIKKWEDIGENYLDSNLEYTKDASQKLNFEQVLQKSIELLPTDIENVTGLSSVMYEISRRIFSIKPSNGDWANHAYNKLIHELVTRLVDSNVSIQSLKQHLDSSKLSMPEISNKVIEDQRFLDFKKDITRKIMLMAKATNYSSDERKIMGRKFQEEFNQFRAKLITELVNKEKVKDSYNKKLLHAITEIRKNNRGLIYAIENQKGCISYIIGSMHMSPSLLDGTKIPEVVGNSCKFFSEIGTNALILERMSSIGNDKRTIDSTLTKLASEKCIPIHALETPKDLIKVRTTAIEQVSSSWSEDEQKKKLDSKLKKLKKREEVELFKKLESSPIRFLENLLKSAWKKGDSQMLKRIEKALRIFAILDFESEVNHQSLKLRNNNWLLNTNLLTTLENTEHPISIVVGLNHLFGKTGLLKAFEARGLKVEQI